MNKQQNDQTIALEVDDEHYRYTADGKTILSIKLDALKNNEVATGVRDGMEVCFKIGLEVGRKLAMRNAVDIVNAEIKAKAEQN